MGLNNINTGAMGQFVEQVKTDPSQAKKSKRVEGEWVFEEGKPQFLARLAYSAGERTVESDLAPFMGGRGLAPDPIQYCLYGLASCFAGTFAALAAQEGVALKGLRIAVENRVDLTRTLGLSENPIVEEVEITLQVQTDAPRQKVEALEALTRERCPGAYCLTNPIPLKTRVEAASD